jgi:hypothetical protein
MPRHSIRTVGADGSSIVWSTKFRFLYDCFSSLPHSNLCTTRVEFAWSHSHCHLCMYAMHEYNCIRHSKASSGHGSHGWVPESVNSIGWVQNTLGSASEDISICRVWDDVTSSGVHPSSTSRRQPSVRYKVDCYHSILCTSDSKTMLINKIK